MMAHWHVYTLRCADDSLYTGVATDVARRLTEHNGQSTRAGARYTRARRPVRLVYKEPATSRGDACRREAQIKRMSKKAKEAMITGAASHPATNNTRQSPRADRDAGTASTAS